MKKVIWIVLLIALVAAVFSVSAYAETKSGTCGDNLTWTLDDDGVLVIEGTGRMYDYYFIHSSDKEESSAPWDVDIQQVILKNGVTSIGNIAFYGCSDLKSVSIPDSIISIGNYAFDGCSSLTSIVIPDSVTNIGRSAFYDCSSLISINIPDSVTNIEYNTFNNCSCLTSVTIPNSVTNIDDYAFSRCTELQSLTIPDSVTSIGWLTFSYCSGLSSISIPDSLTNISYGAFMGCSGLSSISIPDSVTSIDQDAFYDCSGLKSITIPNSVTSIGYSAFGGCSGLTSITIPDSVTSIGEWAFIDCSGITGISIPESVTSIGSYAFNACKKLKNVIIPNRTISLGDAIFTSNPTIYCYFESDADYWAAENGYPVVYLDDFDISTLCTIDLPDDFELPCGETRTINASVFPANDNPAITWVSSNPAIVTVDENGVITALTPGTAVITATVNGISASVTVTAYLEVQPIEPQSFDLSETEIWLLARNDIPLSVTSIIPEGADLDLTWTSSDTAIATVNETGYVHTVRPGDATITATSANGIARECVVHACYSVSAIAFAEDAVQMAVGLPRQLTVNVTMNTQSCVNRFVTFASSDETVATVNERGLVTPIAPGTAQITATPTNGKADPAVCTVTVAGEATIIRLPANLTRIESEAFADLTGQILVVIPTSASIDIAPDAFTGSGVTIECPAGSPTEAWARANGIPTVNP